MRKLLLVLVLLMTGSAFGSIAVVGSCSAATTSCTNSGTPAAGQVKLVFAAAFSAGGTIPTIPTCATGFICPATGAIGTATSGNRWSIQTATTGTTAIGRVGCETVTGAGDTGSGTWTNAGAVASIILSGSIDLTVLSCDNALGYYVMSQAKATTTNSFPALGAVDHTTNMVIGFAFTSGTSLCTPAGLTAQSTTATGPSIGVYTSATGITSWAAHTCTITSSTRIDVSIEAVATCSTASTTWCGDDLLDYHGGTAGNVPTTTDLGTNRGPDASVALNWALTPSPLTVIQYAAHNPLCTLTKSVVLAQDTASPTTFTSANTSLGYSWLNTSQQYASLSNTGGTTFWSSVSFCVTVPAVDMGASWAPYDMKLLENFAGNFCVVQYVDGNSGGGQTGPHFTVHTDSGATDYPFNIPSGGGAKTYWISLGCDWRVMTAYLAVYDTNGLLQGSITSRTGTAAANSNSNDIRIGQGEIGTHGPITYENEMTAYTNHDWPWVPAAPAAPSGAGIDKRGKYEKY